jgi:hypothetical protein
MSKNSTQQTKNKIGNTISGAKKSIESTKKEIQEAIGLIKTFCELPSRGINFSIKWIDAIDAVRMLIEILAGLIGRKLPELKIDLSKFLVTKVFSLSKQLTFDLSEILKSCFACKINPIIPEWLYDEGINIEIEQIDNRGMFKVNPQSRAGTLLYGGSDDMNRFLFDVIQSPTPLGWPNSSDPIATFEFIETGAKVGYNKDVDTGVDENNRGAQNADERNNVINMKINRGKYEGKTFIDFMNDYLSSQNTIFEPKLVFPQSIDVDYGVIARLANLDTLTLRKQVELETVVEELYTCGFDNPNVIIDNSFFDFSKEQKENIEERVEQKKRGVIQMNECCCGADSTIDTASIVNFSQRLKNANEINDQTTVINNGLTQMATLSTNNVNETDKSKGFWEFITRFIGNLSTIITMMVISPKLNFLIITLFYMLNGECRFNSIRDYMKSIQCVIREIMQKILRAIIYEFLLPKILKSMSFILKCYLKLVVKSKLDGYRLSIESLVPFASSPIMKEVQSIMGTPQELINGAIDAGVDSTENYGRQAIDTQTP